MEYNEAVQLNVRVDVQLDAETISSAVINGTADLVQAVEGLTEALTKGALFEKFQTGVEALSAGTSMIEISQSKSVLSAVSSVKEYIEAVKEAAPEVGILTAMFPKLSTALSNILPSITGVFSKIGSALSGLLPSITGVFSKIGTALSGISLGWGIVVAAIIAGIILLIQNWDTVKTAFINGWETVKAFLGTAAEWFNTTVIQPVVTFLTALWTRITTFVSGLMVLLAPYIQHFLLLVQTVLGNIQTFFTGLGEYLTGVFSVNWAEQFGAFGEVLNVFFTTVQEIWTAVQTIFEGGHPVCHRCILRRLGNRLERHCPGIHRHLLWQVPKRHGACQSRRQRRLAVCDRIEGRNYYEIGKRVRFGEYFFNLKYEHTSEKKGGKQSARQRHKPCNPHRNGLQWRQT